MNITVYRHIRLDTNEVFYVGIGNERRPYRKASRSKFWHNIVNKTPYRIDILFNDLTWDQACEKEVELISLYGRRDKGKGTLVNMTDGGEGNVGWKPSKEHRLKMSKLMTGRVFSDESKHKMSVATTGVGNSMYGKIFSAEHRRKMSEAGKGRVQTKEHTAKISASNTGLKRSKTTIKKLQESHAHPIIQSLNGEFIKEWISASEANRNGYHRHCIGQCCKGKRENYKGFQWEYKNKNK